MIKSSQIILPTALLALLITASGIYLTSGDSVITENVSELKENSIIPIRPAITPPGGTKPGEKVEPSRDVARLVYEEDLLDAQMKELFRQIEEAMEGDDRAWLVSLARKMRKIINKDGYSAVPAVVRAKMAEALGLATPYAVAELMDFLRDPDSTVAEAAQNSFIDALQDTTISDKDMASIIEAVSAGDFGADVEDAMIDYTESNMRNSVAISTYISILKNGTNEMKEKARKSIVDFVTAQDSDSIAINDDGDYDSADINHLLTPEGLNEWLSNHPDDDDDPDFYKGVE